MKNLTFALSAFAAVSIGISQASIAVAADAAPAQHIRGTLTKVTPTELTISTASGSQSVPVDANTKVIGVVPATAAEITSGAFIGTANVPGATSTSTRALEVVVFPESMAGTGEGDYAWDLPAGKTHSSMTNGTVGANHAGSMMTNGTVGAKRAGSMMTNATVTGVNNGASKTVTLQYKGGSKKVTIDPGTPIVRAVPGSASLLKTGAHVVAFPAASGAAFRAVIVGEQGAVPPM